MKYILGSILFVLVVLPFLLFSQKILMIDPPVFPDESWFLNSTQNLISQGHLISTINSDASPGSIQIRSYSYPPLYFYLVQPFLFLFGNSVFSLRIFSFFVSIFVLGAFFFLLLQVTKHLQLAILGTFLLYFSVPFGMASRIGRMEMLVLLFIILTFWAFLMFCNRNKGQWITIAGIFASGALLTHPLGLFAVVLFPVWILGLTGPIKKKLRVLLQFSIPILVSLLVWIFTMSDRLDLFFSQFTYAVLYKTSRPSLLLTLAATNASWGILLITYGMSGVVAMYLSYKTKKRLYAVLAVSTVLVLGVVSTSIEQWYFVYISVFPIITCMMILSYGINLKNKSLLLYGCISIIIMVVLQGGILLPGIIDDLTQPPSYEQFGKAVSNAIPPFSTVLVSSLPDPYEALKDRIDLTVYASPNISIEPNFTKLLDRTDIVLVNYITNQALATYLQKNGNRAVTINAGGYSTSEVFLLPKDQRQ